MKQRPSPIEILVSKASRVVVLSNINTLARKIVSGAEDFMVSRGKFVAYYREVLGWPDSSRGAWRLSNTHPTSPNLRAVTDWAAARAVLLFACLRRPQGAARTDAP
jgi:hypothetical protein